MARYDQKEDERLDGEMIDSAPTPSDQACALRCETDRSCLAVEYDSSTEMCRRFSSVAGARKARGAAAPNSAGPTEASP